MGRSRRRVVDTEDDYDSDSDNEDDGGTSSGDNIKKEALIKQFNKTAADLEKLLKKKQKRGKRRSKRSSSEENESDFSDKDRVTKKGVSKKKRKIKRKKRSQSDESTEESSSVTKYEATKRYDSEEETDNDELQGKKGETKSAESPSKKHKTTHKDKIKIETETIINNNDPEVIEIPRHKESDIEEEETGNGKAVSRKKEGGQERGEIPRYTEAGYEEEETGKGKDNPRKEQKKQDKKEKEERGQEKAASNDIERNREETKKRETGRERETRNKEEGGKKEERDSKKSKTHRMPHPYSSKRENTEEKKVETEESKIDIHCGREDFNFFQQRIKDNKTPSICLGGRNIEADMERISVFARKHQPFDVKKIKTEPIVRCCSYYNISECQYENVQNHLIRKGCPTKVHHICITCHSSVRAHMAHPAKRCPNARITYEHP